MKDQAGVLVHCNEGRSRSVALAIAYLLKHENWDLKTAFQHVSSKLATTNINQTFKRQLMEYEVMLGKTKSWDFFPRRNSKDYSEHGSAVSPNKGRLSQSGSLKITEVVTEATTTSTNTEVIPQENEIKSELAIAFANGFGIQKSTTVENIQFLGPPLAPTELIKLDPVPLVADNTPPLDELEQDFLSDESSNDAAITQENGLDGLDVLTISQDPLNKSQEELEPDLVNDWLNGILLSHSANQ